MHVLLLPRPSGDSGFDCNFDSKDSRHRHSGWRTTSSRHTGRRLTTALPLTVLMAISDHSNTEPFPRLSPVPSEILSKRSEAADDDVEQPRASSSASAGGRTRRTRGSSLLNIFVNSNPPLGMWQATGEVGSKIPTLPEIKNGAFAAEGWSHEGQMKARGVAPHDIHQRRMAGTSSASRRTRKSSTGNNRANVVEEAAEHPTDRAALTGETYVLPTAS